VFSWLSAAATAAVSRIGLIVKGEQFYIVIVKNCNVLVFSKLVKWAQSR